MRLSTARLYMHIWLLGALPPDLHRGSWTPLVPKPPVPTLPPNPGYATACHSKAGRLYLMLGFRLKIFPLVLSSGSVGRTWQDFTVRHAFVIDLSAVSLSQLISGLRLDYVFVADFVMFAVVCMLGCVVFTAVLAVVMCPSVRHTSVLYRKAPGAGKCLSYKCEIRVSPKISVIPSRAFLQPLNQE